MLSKHSANKTRKYQQQHFIKIVLIFNNKTVLKRMISTGICGGAKCTYVEKNTSTKPK